MSELRRICKVHAKVKIPKKARGWQESARASRLTLHHLDITRLSLSLFSWGPKKNQKGLKTCMCQMFRQSAMSSSPRWMDGCKKVSDEKHTMSQVRLSGWDTFSASFSETGWQTFCPSFTIRAFWHIVLISLLEINRAVASTSSLSYYFSIYSFFHVCSSLMYQTAYHENTDLPEISPSGECWIETSITTHGVYYFHSFIVWLVDWLIVSSCVTCCVPQSHASDP